MSKKFVKIFLSVPLSTLLIALSAHAADWQQTNLQFLHGNEYRKANGDLYSKSMLTVEHASTWAYGSNFFFFDISSPDTEDNTTYYGEISPAFSAVKTGLLKAPETFIKDVLWQLNFELPSAPAKKANLTGVTIEWKDLGMDYLATQFLYRDTPAVDGHTGQFTLVWNKKFGSESFPMEFSGFLDWAGQEGTLADTLQTQPGLYWDLARKTAQKVPIKIGIEYLYWQNKYGIKGLLESLPQAKLTWIF
jgi:hypothetical protein